jgi:hypothetical protein
MTGEFGTIMQNRVPPDFLGSRLFEFSGQDAKKLQDQYNDGPTGCPQDGSSFEGCGKE